MIKFNPSNIAVFIHVAMMNNWESLLLETLEACRISGLIDNAQVNIVTTGGELSEHFGEGKCKVINTSLPITQFEYPTLDLLYQHALQNPDGAVCYCHLKGVSQPHSIPHRRWRQELIDFVLVDWTIRVNHLGNRWTSGPRVTSGGAGWHNEHVFAHRHYSGNYWWARNDYIQGLRPPNDLFKTCRNRMGAEAWIGQSPKINEPIE